MRETDWIRSSMFAVSRSADFNLYMQVEIEANVDPTRVQKVWTVCITLNQIWIHVQFRNYCKKSDLNPFKNSDFYVGFIDSSLFFPVGTVSLWTIMPWHLPSNLHVPDLKKYAWENLSASGRRKLICIAIWWKLGPTNSLSWLIVS